MKILFAGDFVPLGLSKLNMSEYDIIIDSFIIDLFKSSDLNVVNVECPLTQSKTKIIKSGKCLKCEPRMADLLSRLKVGVACIANNHIMDYGQEGLFETLKILKSRAIKPIGHIENNKVAVYWNQSAELSIINAGEIEFGSSVDGSIGYFGYDTRNLFYLIQEEKKRSNTIILVLHGGREFHEYPSPNRVSEYRLLIDFGVDMIVSHHSHTTSGYEIYKGKPIVYGLGNFIFPKYRDIGAFWDHGMLCQANVDPSGQINVKFFPIKQSYNPYNLTLLKTSERMTLLDDWENKTVIIQDEKALKQAWNNYCLTQRYQYLAHLNLINKFLLKLYRKKIIPNGPSANYKDMLVTLNMLRCDAHREEAITILLNELSKDSGFYS